MITVKHTPYYGYGTNCYLSRRYDFERLEAICRRSQIKLQLMSSGQAHGDYFTVREKDIAWFRLMCNVV